MSEFEARQVVIVHEVLWEALEQVARDLGARLVQIPDTAEDDLPSYFFSPLDPWRNS